MRLCRFQAGNEIAVGFYEDERIIPLADAGEAFRTATGQGLPLARSADLLDYLPPAGVSWAAAAALANWLASHPDAARVVTLRTADVQILTPIPRPNKLLLLAGNYAEHVAERGGTAAEREATFPYVFMKPPTTTLVPTNTPVALPAISSETIDWELELAVVIGRRAKGVAEEEALGCVAGYTVLNDLSNRKFRPNPGRQKREKDTFFDWLHGKWFDGFCPCGPCVRSAHSLPDPQELGMELRVGGEVKQEFSTAQMVFPVAAVIAFVSSFVTLEPGDIISTGTGPGVGAASGTFLRPGDVVEATIDGLGTLVTPIVAEDA